jgi:hypothetical protein
VAEIPYSFRVAHPDMLQRGRDVVVRLEVYHQGALVAPAGTSTFTLLRPDGTAVVDAEPVTIDDEVATYAISGTTELTDTETNPYSELYQERWVLDLPDGTQRTIRREACVAPFLWYNPVADVDLLAEYPDLHELVGPTTQSLQGFIDEAVRYVLELLFQQGQWPDLMLSASAFREPIRQRALFLCFKHFLRSSGGPGNRWETLLQHHESEWNAAWGRLSSRIDADLDGHADSTDRTSARRTIHRNVHGRSRRLTARW